MERVTNSQVIFDEVGKLRQQGPRYLTNFYLDESKVKALIDDNGLYCVKQDGCLLLLRQNDDFYNLYFLANSVAGIAAAVGALKLEAKAVVDLIGREEDLGELAAVFRGHGFRDYAMYQRMSKVGNDIGPTVVADERVVFAGSEDAETIHHIISTKFDKYSEHLPTLAEIRTMIDNKTILIIKEQGEIIGIRIFEKNGLTAHARFWYVDPSYREQRIGGKMNQRYFQLCPEIKRFILWVDCAKQYIIERDMHYGYKKDGLVDKMMMKGE